MNRFTRKLLAGTCALGLLTTGTGIAAADDISNNLDASIDAVAEVMSLNVGGSNGTTQLYVTPRNDDGKNGCNLTGSTTLVLAVSSSNTSAATVSPSSVTFTSCSDIRTLTVTPVAQGSATVSVSQTSNSTDGTFNLAPASFTVNVAPPANTAPAVNVAGVTGGAEYNKDAVPVATCQVTDAEDGDSSFPATLSDISGPYAAYGYGSQTASCSYTDRGGLHTSASETYSIVNTPPVVRLVGVTDGGRYNFGSVPSATCQVTDAEDGDSSFRATLSAIDGLYAAFGYGTQMASCSYTDDGGSTATAAATYEILNTPPVVTLSGITHGASYELGSVPMATCQVVDAEDPNPSAGVALSAITGPLSGHGLGSQTASCTYTDNGGATGGDSVTYNIVDTVAPEVSLVGGPQDGGSYVFGSVPAAPTCIATDNVALLGGCTVSGYSSAVGSHTVEATATDVSGNRSTTRASYDVAAWTLKGFYQPVDMGGVWNTVKGGSTVPLKFEVFAGATELSQTSAITAFKAMKVACQSGAASDAIEIVSTGGTSLRYDATGGQFIQNWQTPKAPGTCYTVAVTTADGSTIAANFALK